MSIPSLVKSAIRAGGFELRRYRIQTSLDAQLARILAALEIDLVIDVGAHEGQYATLLRSIGYSGRIVSFEPLAAIHARLTQAACRDALWEIAPRTALGDADGSVRLNVSAHSLSSSILPMLPLHREAAPGSQTVGIEEAPIVRLDAVAGAYVRDARRVLLKIDTQGFEAQVLAGAERLLPSITALQIELSLAPLYDGQPLYAEMIDRVNGLGYELHALFPGFVDERTGRTLQFDGFFTRRS